MSDIQRYQPFPYDRWMQTSVGNFVTYADHVAALRAAEQRALDAAREAIRNREDGEYFPWVQVEIAIAAIDALRGER